MRTRQGLLTTSLVSPQNGNVEPRTNEIKSSLVRWSTDHDSPTTKGLTMPRAVTKDPNTPENARVAAEKRAIWRAQAGTRRSIPVSR